MQVKDLDEKDRKVTLLLGDIGGTNCRFELVDADLRTRERLNDGTFAKACLSLHAPLTTPFYSAHFGQSFL